jgi:hypothetical protein
MPNIETDIPCEPWTHKKIDNVYLVMEIYKEDGTPLDLTGMTPLWDISDSDGVLVSIEPTIDGDEIIISEPATSFASMPLIGNYTHRLHDTTTNQTLVEGKFTLV